MRRFSFSLLAFLLTSPALAQQECRAIQDPVARLACFDKQSSAPDAPATVKKDRPKAAAPKLPGPGWEIRKSKDGMTDKVSCILSPVGRPYVQITTAELNVGYSGRGGVSGFKYRIDDNPPTGMHLPSNIERQIGVVTIKGEAFKSAIHANRLRISTLTVLNALIDEDIDIGSARPLYARMLRECAG